MPLGSSQIRQELEWSLRMSMRQISGNCVALVFLVARENYFPRAKYEI